MPVILKKGKTIALFIGLFFVCNVLAQKPIAGNLKTGTEATNHLLSPTQNIDTLIGIAKLNHEEEAYEEAVSNLQKAMLISEKHPEKYQYLKILLDIGHNYYRSNNYTLAQKYLFQYLDLLPTDASPKEKVNAYGLVASTYYNLGDYNLAHEYKIKSIAIKETLKDTSGMAGGYYDLGSMFFYQGQYEKAFDFYTKSQNLAKASGNQKIVYNTTAALGATYERMRKLDISLDLNLRSLEIADSLNYKTGRAYSLHNIGSNYVEMGLYDKALPFITQSLNIKRELNDQWGIVGSHFALGDLYMKKELFKKSEEHLMAALEIAQRLKSKIRISEVYSNLSRLYRTSNQKDLAIKYMMEFIEMKDSIMTETTLREMGDRQSQFEIQKKENEIALLKKDNELLEAEQKVQQLNNFLAISIAIFLLGLAGLFYWLFLKQRSSSILLKEKNSEIEHQKEQIVIQNKLLESSNENLKNFTSVVSHDLREPLRMIKSYGGLINRRYKSALDSNGQEFLHFMTDAAERMDHLLVDLLSFAKATTNESPLNPVDTKDVLIQVRAMTAGLVDEKNAKIEFNLEEFPIVLGRKSQLHQVFQNLIVNGLNYNRKEEPKIFISCKENCENYIFSVKDNGIGVEEHSKEKIFEMFQRGHGNEEFEGTGIGLATCKKIINLHNGEIWVESIPGEGSEFFFTLPIPENID